MPPITDVQCLFIPAPFCYFLGILLISTWSWHLCQWLDFWRSGTTCVLHSFWHHWSYSTETKTSGGLKICEATLRGFRTQCRALQGICSCKLKFIHLLFNKGLLNTYYSRGAVLGSQDRRTRQDHWPTVGPLSLLKACSPPEHAPPPYYKATKN